MDDRIGQAVALRRSGERRCGSPGRRRRPRRAPPTGTASPPPRAMRRFLLCREHTTTPRSSARLRSRAASRAAVTFAVQAREREVGCGRRLAGGKRLVEAASAAVRDDSQSEQDEQQRDERHRERLEQQMDLAARPASARTSCDGCACRAQLRTFALGRRSRRLRPERPASPAGSSERKASTARRRSGPISSR